MITSLKDNEFRFFAHNFFKNDPNSNFFFFWNFCFFTYFLEKNKKNNLKCFYMWFLSLKIFILFLKLYVPSYVIIDLKDNESVRFFSHNFFKNGPNSIKFFFLKFLFFTYFLEKNSKNYLKCFYMWFLSFWNFNLVFETVRTYSLIFFDNFLF